MGQYVNVDGLAHEESEGSMIGSSLDECVSPLEYGEMLVYNKYIICICICFCVQLCRIYGHIPVSSSCGYFVFLTRVIVIHL